jgi:hypothetical protein
MFRKRENKIKKFTAKSLLHSVAWLFDFDSESPPFFEGLKFTSTCCGRISFHSCMFEPDVHL